MSRHTFCISLLILFVAAGSARANEDASVFFENKVRPILADHCYSCHGPEKQESDLRIDHRKFILQGGSSGDAGAVVGSPSESLILQYARHEVEGMEMPPEQDRLSDEKLVVLEKWIADGMVWPDDGRPTVLTMDQRLTEHRESHWAFRLPQSEVVDMNAIHARWRSWPKTGLDRFVLRRLLQNEMTPAPQADDRTLLRRLKFDVVGLPPTFSESQAFAHDADPDRDSRWVEQLLSSPQYGEHWGRHWLDVARYADTKGYAFQNDRNYPWAYTYRDYAVRSFNEDLPFDEFIVQQLAADLLPQQDDNRSLAALGFLTVGRKFNNQHDDIDDRIDAVTRGFMGLTIACARCHDHKYDAIPTEDYYSLYGVFASSREPGDLPLIGEPETLQVARDYEKRFVSVEAKLNEFDKQLEDEVKQSAHQRVSEYILAAAMDEENDELRPKLVEAWKRFIRRRAKPDEPTLMPWSRLRSVVDSDFAQAAKDLAKEIETDSKYDFLNKHMREAFVAQPPKSKRELAELLGKVLTDAYDVWQKAGGNKSAQNKQTPELRQLLWYFSDPNSPATINAARAREYSTDKEKRERQTAQAAVDELRKQTPASYHRAMVMRDNDKPATAHVFIRGQAGRRGPEVKRQPPSLLAPSNGQVFANGSGRLELAQVIANEQNPLTARVFVNRVWMHYFGRPLVNTPSDFGIRCDAPLHQDLLDYLASQFMKNGWSIKRLHREILLSATYQQASVDRSEYYEGDPENTFLWRMNRKRLGFEATRDALLSVSGRLDTTVGGKAEKFFRKLETGRRRSIYGYVDRQDLPNLLRVFDFASPDQSAAKRTSTMVPQQALFLLNSPFVSKLSEELAQFERWASLSNEEFVTAAYREVLAREPEQTEKQVGIELLESGEDTVDARGKFFHLLMLTNEFVYVD